MNLVTELEIVSCESLGVAILLINDTIKSC